ncbi:MAG: hypothetical protein HY821_16595 [Acidobacteria bacterium]|nr:hypothetical protein [Acidobacteriota bacterium]
MSPRRLILVFLALTVLFLAANRAAYKGYFSDDDLDNLVQTRGAEVSYFAKELVSPKFSTWNFRPVGHAYYRLLGDTEGLRFPVYIGVLHALHLLNVVLVFLVLRRLGATQVNACAGALLFAFHMACFDAYWKPMYVFDVGCAFFVLLALLAYLNGRWLLALIPFWLAYKTKETAVALPMFLLLYEWLLGERKFKRLLPFFAVSVNFGLQAMLAPKTVESPYTFRFTGAALWTTISYYSAKVLLAPYSGLLLIPAAWWLKDRRIWLGVAGIAVLLGPLWFLPERTYAVYLYLPLIGLAIAAAFAAERISPVCIGIFFLLWIPSNYLILRKQRGVALEAAQQVRGYVQQVGGALAAHPDWKSIVYDRAPLSLHPWGVSAAYRWFQPARDFRVDPIDSAEGRRLLQEATVQTASWNPARRVLSFQQRVPGAPNPSFVDMAEGNPAWLFLDGWHAIEAGFRWMKPQASLALQRPADARSFAVRINFGPVQFQDMGRVDLELLLDGQSLGIRSYTAQGWHEQQWALPAGPAGPVQVTLRVGKPYKPSNGDPRPLGAAIVALGFKP